MSNFNLLKTKTLHFLMGGPSFRTYILYMIQINHVKRNLKKTDERHLPCILVTKYVILNQE